MGYYIANQGVQQGPIEVQDLVRHGLRPDTLVWTEGMAAWQRADTVAELMGLLQITPTQTIPLQAAPAPAVVTAGVPGGEMLSYRTPMQSQPNGMAIASMVLGIVSFPLFLFWCIGAIPAILAIVFGFIARGKISRQETQVGGGMALTGLILGFLYIGMAGLAIAMIAVLAANTP